MIARVQLALILLVAVWAGPARGAPTEWLMEAWRVEDGLPDTVIDAITQTSDGYLWLGTQGGLARFDGLRFQTITDPRLKISRIRHLFVGPAEWLWIVGESGDVAFIHEGEIKTFTDADGVPPNGFNASAVNSKGQVWFSSRLEEGVFYFDGDRFVKGLSEDLETMGSFDSLAFDVTGALFGTRLGEIWKLLPDDGAELQFNLAAEELPLLCPSKQGAWLIVNGACYRNLDGAWLRVADAPDIVRCHEDAAGRLWMVPRGFAKALVVDTNGIVSEQFFSRFNLHSRALFEDREGTWWWATSNDGLRRFRPRQLELVSDATNLPPNSILAVAADPVAGVWALLGRGLVRVADPRSPAATLLRHNLQFPNCLWVDADETVWVGGARGDLFHLTNSRMARLRHPESALPPPAFNALFRDASGTLLAGFIHGLFQGERNAITPLETPAPMGMDFRAFAQDGRGRLYAGLRIGGLLCREGDTWSRINDLPGDDVAALYADSENTLWIGVTGRGLCRLRGNKVFHFQPGRLLLPQNISGIVEDQLGYLWLSSSQGIFRIARDELNALADGRTGDVTVRRFDKSDGLISTQCAGGQQPVSARSMDGKLWFATTRGLFTIDPTQLRINDRPPSVAVEEILIDDQRIWTRPLNSTAPQAPTTITVPPQSARLEFRFAALSLVIPQRNRLRYQLVGWDRDWQEASATRNAQYTRVRPGDYQFRVIAANNDGLWNQTGVTLAVVVLPPWWQTFWFRSTIVVTLLLLAYLFYWLRVARLQREHAAQQEFSRRLIESQEQERQRIAAELHDGLGQSLLVVKNYAFLALKESTTPEKMRHQLAEISANTTASLEEVRNIARALRPYQLDRFGLTKTLEDVTELLAKATDLKVETKIDEVDDAFSPEAQIAIYRVVQEWANNIIKHAQAATARLIVIREAKRVRFRMEDDGVGFDYVTVMNRSGATMSFGLANLQERARLLNGTLKIESAPGQGTRLLMELPT